MNRTIGLITANYPVPGYGCLTEDRPPAILPYGGRYRLMDFALSNMVNANIRTVGLITPYYYRSILDHVGAGKEWGLDRKQGGLFILPGTVSGFRGENCHFLLRDITRNAQFLEGGDGDYLLCSDCEYVYNADFGRMINQHEFNGHPLTFLFKKMEPGTERPGRYLEIGADGFVKSVRWATSGENLCLNCFIVDKSFLLRVIREQDAVNYEDFFDTINQYLSHTSASAFEFKGYVGYTGGGTLDYIRCSRELLDADVRRELFGGPATIYTKIHDEPPALFDVDSCVHNSIISAGSRIFGAVKDSVLFREVIVEPGASVTNCIIMESCVIHSGARLDNVICDKNVVIGSNVVLSGTEEHPCLIPKGHVI